MSKKKEVELLLKTKESLQENMAEPVEVKEETGVFVEDLAPKNLMENEVYVSGKGVIRFKGTKLKYFKNGDYNNFMLIRTMGINEILRYDDGETVLKSFLGAVLDIDKEQIDFLDEMTTETLFEFIDKANKINGIKEEDFLTKLRDLEVITTTESV
jgi:hypothetical protein